MRIDPVSHRLKGKVKVPGDKSIAHRAAIFASLAHGRSLVRNAAPGGDFDSTLRCLAAIGTRIERKGDAVSLEGGGLAEPQDVLDAGNSGTTARLLCGVLAGAGTYAVITGDASLRRRPMSRVINPLREMGANITGRCEGRFAPVTICPASLRGAEHVLSVASAQVKSSLLLAGLMADGPTTVTEPWKSRDHTERLLPAFGAHLEVNGTTVRIYPGTLHPADVDVPGDFSSAAFLIAAACTIPGSELMVEDVGLNPTRTGLLDVLRRMGAEVEVESRGGIEPAGTIWVTNLGMHGTDIMPGEIPSVLDEIPVLSCVAAVAEGTTRILGASELRVKETDRLEAIRANLSALGARVEVEGDSLIITGVGQLEGGRVRSFGDHRIAMAMAVAALNAKAPVEIDDVSCVDISYPGFFQDLASLVGVSI